MQTRNFRLLYIFIWRPPRWFFSDLKRRDTLYIFFTFFLAYDTIDLLTKLRLSLMLTWKNYIFLLKHTCWQLEHGLLLFKRLHADLKITFVVYFDFEAWLLSESLFTEHSYSEYSVRDVIIINYCFQMGSEVLINTQPLTAWEAAQSLLNACLKLHP